MQTTDRVRAVVTLLAVLGAAAAVALLHIEEGLGLPRLMPLLAVGFAIHAWLPLRFRLSFFLALAPVAAVLLFGPTSALLLTGSGLVLVGACHLPIPYRARLVVVLLLAAGLAVVRVGWVEVPGATAVLPVLASIFMFRLMIYLYDLPHERKPVPVQIRLAYFFLFPNFCFPLFPVVDYQRFKASHYATDADAIHRKGVGWMLLGTTHIVAYRALHLYLIPDVATVRDLEGVVLWVITAYLQYLRISGMFHVAAGMVCLFGFDLPATNRWFFFASTYGDLWRRINTYWKDFVQKLMYFPVFMRLRKSSMERRVVAATVVVFVGSWALHTWQWFWLQGEVLISDVDLAFWGLVGGSLVVSSMLESRKGEAAAPRAPAWEAVALTSRIALVFLATSFLWSLWISDSLEEWWFTLGRARYGGWEMAARVSAVALAVLASGVGLSWLHLRAQLPDLERVLHRGPVLLSVAAGLVAMGGAAPVLSDDFPVLALALEPDDGPIGYYEGLMEGEDPGVRRSLVPVPRSGVWDLEDGTWWDLYEDQQIIEKVDDLRGAVLRPLIHGTMEGLEFRTNEYGMRDDSVSLEHPPGVMRVALLGASPEMGWGVSNGEDYPALLEEHLGPGVEILNFAVAGYGPVQQVSMVEAALEFDPDVVLLVSHCRGDIDVTQRLLTRLVNKGPPFPEEIADFVPWDIARAAPRRAAIARELEPLTRWAYERVATRSRDHGAVPVWVYLRLPNSTRCSSPGSEEVEGWAEEAGFRTLRLSGLYQGQNQATLTLGSGHPTAEGHRIIATHLAEVLGPELENLRTR